MKSKYLSILFILITSLCYGERTLHPAKYNDQEEVLEEGGVMLLSSKVNEVLFYQTQEALKRGRANFFFSITNTSDKPINLYPRNLVVTDQHGHPIRIVPKRELIKNRKKATGWKLFSSGILACLETNEANHAGLTTFSEETHSNERTVSTKRGRIIGTENRIISSRTHGIFHNEGERQRALQEAHQIASLRDQSIVNEMAHFEERMHENYFDAETIYPQEMFSANIQIDVPKNILKNLEFILFHFDLGEENHTFAFFVKHR